MFGAGKPSLRSDALIVFARSPGSGAKTRLVPDLGTDGAERLYNAMFLDTLALARGAGTSVLLSLAGAPDRYELPKGWIVVKQPDYSFGQRMEWSFDQAFGRKADRAVLIGADLPHLPRAMLPEAFVALSACDAVIGPTHDGGYYLLGLRRPAPWLFLGIAWSTSDVFEQTLALLRSHAVQPVILPEARDIDTLEDAIHAQQILRAQPGLAPLTARVLNALLVPR